MSKSQQGITTRKVMREAILPALDYAKQLVPVGKPNNKTDSYRRGGALKDSLRAKVVKDSPFELKGLVGSSRKGNDVGWRAHFSEFGPSRGGVHTRRFGKTKGKKWVRKWRYNPFLRATEQHTKDLVIERLKEGLNSILVEDFKGEQ